MDSKTPDPAVGARRTTVRRHPSPARALVIIAISGLVASCGALPGGIRPGATASPTPTTSPTTAPSAAPPLFVVLEVRGAGKPPWYSPDTIALAGADGYAVAKTSIPQRSAGPGVFDAAVVGPPPAVVANGAVYFLDGLGVIRRLDRSGAVRPAAEFSMTSDQNLSFAVSPDGSTIIAARMTFPHMTPKPNPSPDEMPFTMSGQWALEILKAKEGSAPTLLQRWEAANTTYPDAPGSFKNIQLVAWDATGPIALVSSHVSIQNSLWNQHFFGGYLAHLDANGLPGRRIGPVADCEPQAVPVAGRIVCVSSDWATLTVRTVNGTILRRVDITGSHAVGPLSPDGTRVALPGKIISVGSGASLGTPASFVPAVWLDDNTLIGTIVGSNAGGTPFVGELRLKPTVTVEDWHFTGTVVDVLR